MERGRMDGRGNGQMDEGSMSVETNDKTLDGNTVSCNTVTLERGSYSLYVKIQED